MPRPDSVSSRHGDAKSQVRVVDHRRPLAGLRAQTSTVLTCVFLLSVRLIYCRRKHLQSIGHPILGDPLYSPLGYSSPRLCLWSLELCFPNPKYYEESMNAPTTLEVEKSIRTELEEPADFGRIRYQHHLEWNKCQISNTEI